jgi:hypothetical protein
MKVGIYIPLKNETRIVELINYYMYLNFDYFILFDDNSEIPISEILETNNFDLNNFSIIINNYYMSIKEIYSEKHWFNLILPILFEKEIDYLLHIDADEILYIKNFTNIKDVIHHFSPFDRIHINWVCFGGNVKYNNSLSIINTFTKCEENLQKVGKSLVKVSSLKINYQNGYVCPHILKIKENSIEKDINNNIIDLKNDSIKTTEANMYIAHYSHQDIENYVSRKLCSSLHLEVYYSHLYNIKTKQKLLLNLNKYKNKIIEGIYDSNNSNTIINEIKDVNDPNFFILFNAAISTYSYVYNNLTCDNYDVINFYKKIKKNV